MADNFQILDANGNFITIVTSNNAGIHTPWHYNTQQIANAVVSNTNPVPTTIVNLGFVSSNTLTRPTDTTAYTAGDVLGSSNSVANSAVLTFANIGANNIDIQITSVQWEVDIAANVAGETTYNLYLYNTNPPSTFKDNDPWDLPAGDRPSFLGSINLGQAVDLGSTLYLETNSINKQIRMPNGNTIFGYLQTVGAFTPGSARVQKITLHSRAVV